MNNTKNVDIIDNEKVNNSQALITEKEYKGMKISGINLSTSNGVTNFTAAVENNTENDYEGEIVTLVFLNEDGSEYGRLDASIPRVKKGEVTEISAGTTSDLTNAYDFKIE